MRYAVLSDIHGNLPALEAVLAALAGEDVDAVLVAGDLVGYGPFPNECVERVAALEAICVAGNHDLIALGRLSDDRCIELARRSLAWTREVLGDETRRYLEALPARALAPEGVLVAHGSLDHAWEYTTRPEQAAEQLGRLAREQPAVGTLVLGHTHRPFACDETGRVLRLRAGRELGLDAARRRLLNPGAVGQSRELRVRARYLVLDTARETADFRAVDYDVAACERALVAAGLPAHSYRIRPSLAGALRRVARRLPRRSRRPRA